MECRPGVWPVPWKMNEKLCVDSPKRVRYIIIIIIVVVRPRKPLYLDHTVRAADCIANGTRAHMRTSIVVESAAIRR